MIFDPESTMICKTCNYAGPDHEFKVHGPDECPKCRSTDVGYWLGNREETKE